MAEDVPDLRSAEGPIRREDGTFAPGKSPNPGGQAPWLKAIKAELRKGAPIAVARLISVIQNGADKDANAASKTLLEFILPKPKQSHKVEGNGSGALVGLTSEALVAFITGKKEGT